MAASAKHLPPAPGTLAFVLGAPFWSADPPTDQPAKAVAERIRAYQDATNEDACSEGMAVDFYALNHVFAQLAAHFHTHEPLPAIYWTVADTYREVATAAATRMFAYLTLICVKEGRHRNGGKGANFEAKFLAKHDHGCLDFVSKIASNGLGSSVPAGTAKLAPQSPFGMFSSSLSTMFYEGGFGSSYGGPKWGAVADCLASYARGETSIEAMLDTSFTLAHNTGPIFNKGMLFKNQNNGRLMRVLDVQRAGLMPTAVLHDKTIRGLASPGVRNLLDAVAKLDPGDNPFEGTFNEYVDWYEVEALGAVGSYESDKEAQVSKHGLSPNAAKVEAKKLAAQKAKQEKAKKLAEEKIKKAQEEHFEIGFGEKYPKLQRKDLIIG